MKGTPKAPISWRLPEVSDPRAKAVLRAARHYVALDRSVLASTDRSALFRLYPAVATARALQQRRDSTWEEIQPETGPLWYWFQEPQPDGKQATVRACVDLAWHAPADEQNELPRTPRPAASVDTYVLRKVASQDGDQVWKVARVGTDGANPDRGGFSGACAKWADHKPQQ